MRALREQLLARRPPVRAPLPCRAREHVRCRARERMPRRGGHGNRGGRAADRALALYVHLPWCVRKCPYCDFNSHQLKSARPDGGYIDALMNDFDEEFPLIGRPPQSIPCSSAGERPSLFAPEDFARLLHALRQRIEFASDAEITLEANPGTIERGRFTGYRDAGINRISLGAQTFCARALEQLGRIHTADDTSPGGGRAARVPGSEISIWT